MKTYLRLTCSNCLRSIDRAINVTHYTPDKCTITLGCEGRLSPGKKLSNPTIALTSEVGVKDWHARQLHTTEAPPEVVSSHRTPTVISTNVIGINEGLVNGETGQTKQIVLAIKASTQNRLGELPKTARVIFDVASDTPRDYKHHILRTDTEIQDIAASDPRLNPRPIRYNVVGSTPDQVEIRINGVARPRSASDPQGFQLFDGSNNGVPPNSIRFNTPIPSMGRTQVDITITKTSGTTSQQTGTFKLQEELNDSRVGTGSYENVSSVEKFNHVTGVWDTFNLYAFDLDSSGLKLNSLLTPAKVQIETGLDFTTAFFLLARAPYTQVDRYTSVVIPFTNFAIEDKKFIKYYEDTQLRQTTMRVSVETLETVYPLLKFKTFTVEKPLTKSIPGVEEQITIDGNIIIGPDS